MFTKMKERLADNMAKKKIALTKKIRSDGCRRLQHITDQSGLRQLVASLEPKRDEKHRAYLSGVHTIKQCGACGDFVKAEVQDAETHARIHHGTLSPGYLKKGDMPPKPAFENLSQWLKDKKQV